MMNWLRKHHRLVYWLLFFLALWTMFYIRGNFGFLMYIWIFTLAIIVESYLKNGYWFTRAFDSLERRLKIKFLMLTFGGIFLSSLTAVIIMIFTNFNPALTFAIVEVGYEIIVRKTVKNYSKIFPILTKNETKN